MNWWIIQGDNMNEAKQFAMLMSKTRKLIYVNGYDHPNIIAGQGTIGLEICEQVANADAVVVPVGGGGLIAGIATAVKALSPNTKIIVINWNNTTIWANQTIQLDFHSWQGVESEKCPSFSKAIECGQPTPVPIEPTLADGLAVPMVGYNAYVTTIPLLDKMVVVKEEWIALAILRLVEQEKRKLIRWFR